MDSLSCLAISDTIDHRFLRLTPTPSAFLYPSARAAVTKHHRLGGINNRTLFSHGSGGWSPRSGCQQGWFQKPREGSVPGFRLLSRCFLSLIGRWYRGDQLCVWPSVVLRLGHQRRKNKPMLVCKVALLTARGLCLHHLLSDHSLWCKMKIIVQTPLVQWRGLVEEQ